MSKKPLFAIESPFTQLLFFAGLAILSMLVFSIAAAAIVIPMYDVNVFMGDGVFNNLKNTNVVSTLKIMQLFNSLGLFVVPALLFAKWTSLNVSENLGFNFSFNKLLIPVVIIMVITALPLINWIAELNSMLVLPAFLHGLEQWMKNAEEEATLLTEAFLTTSSIVGLLFNLLLIAIIPAVGEELMFRGVIQKLFTKITNNPHLGIWIAAILFSALHGQFYGFIPRMLLGAVFGYLLKWSGSLWLPILGHLINNGFAVIVSYLITNKIISKDVENFGTDNQLVYVVISAIIVGGLIFVSRKLKQSNNLKSKTTV